MRKIFSQLLLLVGLSLMFNACGDTDTTSKFPSSGSSTNVSGGGNNPVPSSDNSKSPAETKPADNGDRVIKVATKVLFVDTFCSGLPTTILNVNNTVIETGETNEDGSFSIPADSDAKYVQFSIGGITLGKVEISQVITISELFKNSNLDDKRVIFAVRLLLSLDSDGDSSNGIQLVEISDKIKDFKGIDGYSISNLNVDENTATKLLTALLDFLGVDANKIVSEEEAKSHLEDSMNELERDVTIEVLPVGESEICPNGGIAKIHKVDFDKSDKNKEKTTYIDYICDAPLDDSNKDEVTNFVLTDGNEKCPQGGIRTHHKLYNSTQDLLSEYDEYKCQGSEAYKTNTFIFYSETETGLNENCQKSITKLTQVTKDNSISVIVQDDEYICVDNNSAFIEVSTIIEDAICKIGGIRVNSFEDDSKEILIASNYYCNQETKNGNTQGEHNVIVTDADSETCPDGGKFYTHYVDYDNNGEVETIYKEVKCDYAKGTENKLDGEVTILTTKILLNAENKDSHCPNGGYRLERKMMQNDRIIAEYNDYNCSGLSKNLIDDKITPEVLRSSDYNTKLNSWCPNGGLKYNHEVYFNGSLNHSYYDINCSPASQKDNITESILPFEDKNCPNGGTLFHHSVVFNGDAGHPSNYEFDKIVCNDLNYETDTYELNDEKPLLIGDKTCPFGGKIITHKRYMKDETNQHLAYLDFNSTECNKIDYEQTEEEVTIVQRFIIGDGNTICPDGGEIKNHRRFVLENNEKAYLPYWDYNTTHCSGLDYNDTIDVPTVTDENPEVCPYGGKVVLHQRFLLDKEGRATKTHIAKWDYSTTTCNRVDYANTLEKKDIETLEFGSDICPDGGEVISHSRYVDENANGVIDAEDRHIADWDYSETICKGLNYDETVADEVVTILEYGNDVCPDGGKVISYVRYIDADKDGKFTKDVDVERVPNWDYTSTQCSGLNYNETEDKMDYVYLDFGNETCPDGGVINQHIFYANIDDSNPDFETHVAKWDYNTTVCKGLNYDDTLQYEKNTTLAIGDESCPDGGTLVQTIRYVDNDNDGKYDESVDRNIEHWGFNSTYCTGLEYSDTIEVNASETDAPLSDCPNGGTVIEHERWTVDADGKPLVHIEKWDYPTTHCNGEVVYGDKIISEIILPVGNKECPNGGKIIERNITINGIFKEIRTETLCGKEGTSVDTNLDSNFTVVGYIKDMNGSIIEGAKVTLYISHRAFTVETGSNGVYQLYNAMLGFDIEVEADGYQKSGLVKISSDNMDITLVPERLSYVNDMELIFFNIDREMGGNKALEYAKAKGIRLLTFEELSALYYSDRKSEFKQYAEYISSTHKTDNDDGYTLQALNFGSGEAFDFWYDWRKHVVFTNVADNDGIASKEFKEQVNSWAKWDSANAICSSLGLRLPSVAEMKTIYFNSTHPIGIADKLITGGEYWTLDTNEKDGTAQFFRVVGPVEDYYIDFKADKLLTKKVLCVTPDANETSAVYGKVTDSDGNKMKDVKINLIAMDSNGQSSNIVSTTLTDENGEYYLKALSNRYLVVFDPTLFDSNLKSETTSIDLRKDSTLDIQFKSTNEDEDRQDKGVCDNDACSNSVFDISSIFDKNTNKWTYKVSKGTDSKVDAKSFTIKLSALCLTQITELSGGTPIALNGKGVIDSIQSDENNEISFLASSTAGYDLDVEAPLVILTSEDTKLGVNVAIPVCFHLMVPNEETKTEIIEIAVKDIDVSGVVKTTEGEAVANANVIIKDEKGETLETLLTDEMGSYTYSTKTGMKVSIEVSSEKYESQFITLTQISEAINKFNFNNLELKKYTSTIILDVVNSENANAISNATYIVKDSDNKPIATNIVNNNGKTEITLKQTIGKPLAVSLEISAQGYESNTELLNLVEGENTHQTKLVMIPSQLQVVVTDSKMNTLEKASVNLYVDGEETPRYFGFTNDIGIIVFENIISNDYRVSISLAGNKEFSKDISLLNGNSEVVFATMELK